MLEYRAAFYMPKKPGEMVVVDVLDFPGFSARASIWPMPGG